jgi:hypothetical protein
VRHDRVWLRKNRMCYRWVFVIEVVLRLQTEHMFQDPDDGIIHEVFIQTLALGFGSVKIGSDLIDFVRAVAFVKELDMRVYADSGVRKLMV